MASFSILLICVFGCTSKNGVDANSGLTDNSTKISCNDDENNIKAEIHLQGGFGGHGVKIRVDDKIVYDTLVPSLNQYGQPPIPIIPIMVNSKKHAICTIVDSKYRSDTSFVASSQDTIPAYPGFTTGIAGLNFILGITFDFKSNKFVYTFYPPSIFILYD